MAKKKRPFYSQAQWRYMFANDPADAINMAHATETHPLTDLPGYSETAAAKAERKSKPPVLGRAGTTKRRRGT